MHCQRRSHRNQSQPHLRRIDSQQNHRPRTECCQPQSADGAVHYPVLPVLHAVCRLQRAAPRADSSSLLRRSLVRLADPRLYLPRHFLPLRIGHFHPLTFFSGIGAASRKGILVKGSNYLEALTQLGTVVFDKTEPLRKAYSASPLSTRPTALPKTACSTSQRWPNPSPAILLPCPSARPGRIRSI